VTICGRDYDAMADLVRKHGVAVFGATAKPLGDGQYCVDAYLDEEQMEDLRGRGYRLERHEDVHEQGRRRLADVGEGDRYEPGPLR
jgi:hypothetical protein